MASSNLSLRRGVILVDFPAALESGDRFAVGSPPWRARFNLSLRRGVTPLALPEAHESGNRFVVSRQCQAGYALDDRRA